MQLMPTRFQRKNFFDISDASCDAANSDTNTHASRGATRNQLACWCIRALQGRLIQLQPESLGHVLTTRWRGGLEP